MNYCRCVYVQYACEMKACDWAISGSMTRDEGNVLA